MKTTGKIKYGKVSVVVFITLLIWVWTDLALDEKLSVSGVTVRVAKSTNHNLWVSFNDEISVSVDRVVLKGPASKIADISRKLKEGKRFEFDFDAIQEKMDEPGSYTLALLPFLQKDKQIRRLGLTVESCKPGKLSVNVIGLVEKTLEVKCVDEEQNLIKDVIIEPAQINMFVPGDWEGENLIAKVQLVRREVDQARLTPIEKRPYIQLAANQIRTAAATVKITTPLEEEKFGDYTITDATLGFTMSPNLQGKYAVEVINLDEVIRAITIRATAEAKRAYDKKTYQVILEIDDSDKDVKSEEPLRRELIYKFPEEFVRKDEIALSQTPVIARFKLTSLAEAQTPPIAGD